MQWNDAQTRWQRMKLTIRRERVAKESRPKTGEGDQERRLKESRSRSLWGLDDDKTGKPNRKKAKRGMEASPGMGEDQERQ